MYAKPTRGAKLSFCAFPVVEAGVAGDVDIAESGNGIEDRRPRNRATLSGHFVGCGGPVAAARSDEVGLVAAGFGVGREEIPAQAEIQRQLGIHLPVVLEVGANVPAMVVGSSDIGAGELIHAAYVIDRLPTRQRRDHCEAAGDTRKSPMPFRPVPALADAVGNVGVHAVEAEVAAALRRLRDIGFHIVHLDAGLEGVIAPDLGDRVNALQAIDGLNGGGVVANADAAKTADVHVREAAIVGHLRNPLYAELERNTARTEVVLVPVHAELPMTLP